MLESHSSHRGLDLVLNSSKVRVLSPTRRPERGQPVAGAEHAAWWWPRQEQAPEKGGDSPGGVVPGYKTAWARARHSFFHVSPALHSLCPGLLEYILFLLNFLLSRASPFPRGLRALGRLRSLAPGLRLGQGPRATGKGARHSSHPPASLPVAPLLSGSSPTLT